MKVKDLKGRESVLDIRSSQYPLRSESACRSKIQYRCGLLLQEAFPNAVLLEEVGIPGEKLYLDFFIPNMKLAFEIQGAQHDSYSEFFHGGQKGFERSKQRDSRKVSWCALNSIELISIRTEEELKERLGLNGSNNN